MHVHEVVVGEEIGANDGLCYIGDQEQAPENVPWSKLEAKHRGPMHICWDS